MALTPLDIYNKEFSKNLSLYSYDDAEVDVFLDRVAKAFEELYNENRKLKKEIEQLKKDMEQYKKMEDSLHESLVMAQETVEEMKSNAQREAELTKEEAEKEAERIVRESREQLKEKKRAFEELEKHEQLFRIRFKSLLESHLEMLDSEEDMAEKFRSKVNRIVGISPSGDREQNEEHNEELDEIEELEDFREIEKER